jgi:hypothetical protein
MARDEVTPADPGLTQDTEVNPTLQLPNLTPPAGEQSEDGDSEYQYWLRDGVTPYRTLHSNAEVFSRADDGWMIQQLVDRDKLWPSSGDEIAGMIGGRQRLDEPTKGAMPMTSDPEDSFASGDEDWLATEAGEVVEADATADQPDTTADQPDLSPDADGTDDSGGMTEQQIRDAGLRIDLPFDDPMPVALRYSDEGSAQAWTPPPGWRQGLPPIDEQLAADLGVPRDLGNIESPGLSGGSSQEGATNDGASGEPEPGA